MSNGKFKKGNTAAKGKKKKSASTYMFSNDAHTIALPQEK